jgi:hypothetical protein
VSTRLTREVSKAVALYDSRVKINEIGIETSLIRELFVSSEEANIDRTYALTQGLCVVVAVGNSGIQQSHYDCPEHQRGWEILTDGIDEELIRSKPFMHFAQDLVADEMVYTPLGLMVDNVYFEEIAEFMEGTY